MIISLLLISLLLFILYLKEHVNLKTLRKEYVYINTRLEEIVKQDENNYILVTSDCSQTRQTASAINHLLEKYYAQQIDNHRSQKASLELFTNISHDLRTPITVLKGYIDMLYLQSAKENISSECKMRIEKMSKKTNELVHSIHNIFNMAKLQSGDMIFTMQYMNLTQICRETILEFYDVLDTLHFTVDVNIEDTPIYVELDSLAIQRILKNLIYNAIIYGERGKYLGMSIQEKQERVCISVIDHGKGISAQEQKYIFDRTYTKNKKYGNGLGLAISQELAKAMHGEITVDSEQDVQTTFSLTLNVRKK